MSKFVVGIGAAAGVAAGLGKLPVAVPVFDRVSEVALSLSASVTSWAVSIIEGWGAPETLNDALSVGLPVAVPGVAAAGALVVAEAGIAARRVLASFAVVLALAAFLYLPLNEALIVCVASLLFGAAAWFGGLAAVVVIAASAGLLAVRHLTMLYDGTYPDLAERAAKLDEILGGQGTNTWKYALMGIAGLPFLWGFLRVTGLRIAPELPPERRHDDRDPYYPDKTGARDDMEADRYR